jgi:hypothetical protein
MLFHAVKNLSRGHELKVMLKGKIMRMQTRLREFKIFLSCISNLFLDVIQIEAQNFFFIFLHKLFLESLKEVE